MKILLRLLLTLCIPAFLLSPIPSLAFSTYQEAPVFKDIMGEVIEIPRDEFGRVNPWELLRGENLSIDRYFQFIELVENKTFLESLTEEEFDTVVDFVTRIVRASAPESRPDLQEEYEYEIDELMEDLYGENRLSFSLNSDFDFEINPAVCVKNPEFVLCKGWLKRKADHFGHWCSKHKKPLIIGTVIVGVVAVTVVTGGIGGSSAVAVGGALVGANLDDESPNHINKPGDVSVDSREYFPPSSSFSMESAASKNSLPCFTEELHQVPSAELQREQAQNYIMLLDEQVDSVKVELFEQIPAEALNIMPQEEPSFWNQAIEKGREMTSQFAHGVYALVTDQLYPVAEIEGVANDLLENISPALHDNSPFEENPKDAFQKQVTQGHQKIDEVFQTHYSDLYSDEARGAEAEITTGILPFPGAAIGKTAAPSILAEQEMSHILKEVNQIKTTYPHLKTDKVISSVCNRGNLNEVQIRQVLKQTGFNPPARPKGIPENFTVKASESGGGIKYRLEVPRRDGTMYPKVEVRVMEGNPNSPNLGQQRPYVIHRVDGKFLDKNGNIVSRKGVEPHILFEEYDFEKLSKLVPYE